MTVRMKDIARDLGVSAVTVSKVLRNHSDIGPETRARVLRRVAELNYRPNLAARSLVTGRTYMVGLVVPDLLHPFFAQIAEGVNNVVRPKGYHIVLASSEDNPDLERSAIEAFLARQVDVLILAPARSTSAHGAYQRIRQREVPHILVDRRVDGFSATFVGSDDVRIGTLATKHLISRGHTRIAHIGALGISTADGRLKGFLRVMARHSLPVPAGYVTTVPSADAHGEEGGYKAMKQLLALKPRPQAVFCYNDLTAIGAMKAVLDAGLRIPKDVALMGVANTFQSDMLKVPLTTIEQNSILMGEQAAKLTMKWLTSKVPVKPRQIYVPLKLIVRESA